MVIFQVIKVDSLYNMLLRRPWLHATGAAASTIHRRLRFPSKDQMITIMAKEPLTIFKETSIPYICANLLGSKVLGFYVFRTLICIVGKP